jgi:hypothetical protein
LGKISTLILIMPNIILKYLNGVITLYKYSNFHRRLQEAKRDLLSKRNDRKEIKLVFSLKEIPDHPSRNQKEKMKLTKRNET